MASNLCPPVRGTVRLDVEVLVVVLAEHQPARGSGQRRCALRCSGVHQKRTLDVEGIGIILLRKPASRSPLWITLSRTSRRSGRLDLQGSSVERRNRRPDRRERPMLVVR